MLKSISGLTLLVGALAMAVAFADEPAKTCPGGGCGAGTKATSSACSGCPAAAGEAKACATCTGEKKCADGTCADGKCADHKCTDGKCADGKCTGGACATGTACASGAACAKDGTACASGTCSGADGKTACQGCPSAKTTAATGTACTDGGCASKSCGADCKDCPITAAMKALPQMTFAVGETKTNCPKEAAELAKTANAAIQYVVCEKPFATEAEANVALADATEKFVSEFIEPKKCEESGKIKVCGKDLCCETMAAETATVAKSAMEKVAMTYLVGEKECSCPNEAAKLAKDSGNPTVFVVAGETTCCNVQARLNLARAKYKAAVVALMQTDAPAAETTTPTSTTGS